MNEGFEHIDDLIAKVLAGEAGREEVDMLEDWMNEAEENRNYFDASKKLFTDIDGFKIEHRVDSVKAWEKLNARIVAEGNHGGKVIPLFRRSVVLRAAASVMLIAVLGLLVNYLLDNRSHPAPFILAADKKVTEGKLPDGSKVTINKNSELAYSTTGGIRKVILKGEAFFEVKHNENEPFEIIIDDSIIIRDIGTAFNVKALPESDRIEVYVESGEVHFYSEVSKGIYLVKGEKAVYDKTSRRFTKNAPDPVDNTVSYKSRVFRFNGSTLSDVVKQVNDIYGSNIVLSDERLGNCRLSTTFDDESIDTILEVITETLDLEVQRSEDGIVLKGQPCTE